ncbi:MAG: hypothetical protein EOM73_15550 [Bacteroidia bacterium]|nr:hypothetical protein [Bacteroidia bacterium]
MGKRSRPILAICYDFDGTLAPGNMQEYDFIPQLKIKPAEFWKQAARWAEEQEADKIIAYMCLMLKKAEASDDVCIKRDDFIQFYNNLDNRLYFFQKREW